jgi:prevent-host-death family protein
MAGAAFSGETVSVSDASARGVAGLVREAEDGHDVIVARHGRPVAAVIGMARFESLRELERDLRSACLVLARAATDTGARTSLDDVLAAFGFDRDELEAELSADIAAGRD